MQDRDDSSLEKGESLFPSDHEVLGDKGITRVLEARPKLPKKFRIALLHISHRSTVRPWHLFGTVPLTTETKLDPSLVTTLKSSTRIYDASYLPSFLVPSNRAVGHLREAAARYQADAIFIFGTECHLHEKYRLFGADKTRANCTAEAALLDVRTGIVPFTSVAAQDYTAEKREEDLDLAEAIRRAEHQAVRAAMKENATNLVSFLGSLSVE